MTKSTHESAAKGREGQGRPLGWVIAWLAAFPGGTRIDNVHGYEPNFAARQSHRQRALESAADVPELADLMGRERVSRADEGMEPEYVS